MVTIAGEAGKELESKIGTACAALAIYLKSDPERFKAEPIPNFYCDNDAALAVNSDDSVVTQYLAASSRTIL
ncbi:hypothetical protein K4H02_24855, partial [Mycobacterium tuberculosis]|nr:hypothetical protein [Mycobacterium tuberculosis]